jgi:hypothetical protein
MTTLSALMNEQSASDQRPHFRRVLLVEDEVLLRKSCLRCESTRVDSMSSSRLPICRSRFQWSRCFGWSWASRPRRARNPRRTSSSNGETRTRHCDNRSGLPFGGSETIPNARFR